MNNWPHSPPHRLTEKGVYMIPCGTYKKAHFLNTAERLDMFCNQLFACISETGWDLHAWAILSNHYHFIASSLFDPSTLRRMISKLHTLSARDINLLDHQPGRKVWFQYFDSHITFTNSYLPRLKYVHRNPAHHGVVPCAENYRWCSASWFAQTAGSGFRRTVYGFRIDALSVIDDFVPQPNARFGMRGLDRAFDAIESGVKPPHSKSVTAPSTPPPAS